MEYEQETAAHLAPMQMSTLISEAAEKGALRKVVLSKPSASETVRMCMTLRTVGGKTVIQAERLCTDNKALHENIAPDDRARICALIADFSQVNLLTVVGECELRRSKSGKTVLLKGEHLLRALRTFDGSALSIGGNNLEKQYILSGSEPFLRLLGVSDDNGRVRDKKQSKFRQINRFLELIRDCIGRLPTDGVLRICDLCCGKSYLSFAVYHYFVNVLGREVQMTGVDRKPDVIASCADIAKKLHFDGLSFLCGDIQAYHVTEHVHMVISLHACDVATDLVLQKATEWRAEVILSTPCCHHEMNHTLACPALDFIAAHSMLRQKLCDAATDALRLKRLEANGYAVCALELIDPDETPKNVMLRALRKPHFDAASEEAKRLWADYQRAKSFLVGDAEVSF